MIAELENHLWQSTLFACLVALLTLMLRKNRAAVRHGLWLAASIKFLVPFSLLISIGSEVDWRKVPVPQPRLAMVVRISEPFALPNSPPVVASMHGTPSRLPAIFVVVWLCGFAANSLAWWRRWRRMRAALRAATPLSLKLPIPVMSSPVRLEPGLLGILNPVLLLPEGITEHLTGAQFEAVVAHELCHVRRRDNLAAAIHMVVETLFWFHPLVWWIERRLVEERERACDEAVLRMATDPQDYAEGIVKVCRFYLKSPLVCAVTGANLKRRVEEIMMNRGTSRLNFARKLLLVCTGILAVAGPLAVGVVNARQVRAQSRAQFQTPAVGPAARAPAVKPQSPRPQFEVASIKLNTSGARAVSIGGSPGTFRAENVWLRFLIETAWNVKDFQVSGGPDWATSNRYDINAKAEGNANFEQMRPMLQKLLEDRFQLALHREAKELSVYALIAAKSGIKLKASRNENCVTRDPKAPPTAPVPGQKTPTFCGAMATSPRSLNGTAISMEQLTTALSNTMQRTVIDQTGFSDPFDVHLEWTQDQSTPGFYAPGLAPPASALPVDGSGPTIFTVLQEQLGLRLESTKGPVMILVIDHAQRPSAN